MILEQASELNNLNHKIDNYQMNLSTLNQKHENKTEDNLLNKSLKDDIYKIKENQLRLENKIEILSEENKQLK